MPSARVRSHARRYTSPYAEVVRAKIVLLAAEGLANVDIAARCDTSPQVVSPLAQTVLRAAIERPGGPESLGADGPGFFPPR